MPFSSLKRQLCEDAGSTLLTLVRLCQDAVAGELGGVSERACGERERESTLAGWREKATPRLPLHVDNMCFKNSRSILVMTGGRLDSGTRMPMK